TGNGQKAREGNGQGCGSGRSACAVPSVHPETSQPAIQVVVKGLRALLVPHPVVAQGRRALRSRASAITVLKTLEGRVRTASNGPRSISSWRLRTGPLLRFARSQGTGPSDATDGREGMEVLRVEWVR